MATAAMIRLIDIPATITSIGTLVAAIGALIVSIVNATRIAKAKGVAENANIAVQDAKSSADSAKKIAEESKAEIIATKDGVYEIGKKIDGRLSELLEVTRALSRAEGMAQGRQMERKERNDIAGKTKPKEEAQ